MRPYISGLLSHRVVKTLVGSDSVIPRLHREVESVLSNNGLSNGKRLVLAVSGGPDSMAMLSTLYHLSDDLGLTLHGAHLDHGLRGRSSEEDARFVVQTLRRLGIAYTVERAEVELFMRTHRLSLEEAARKVRYAFLARVASDQRADAVALGHTSDDQVETVLMHIIRGAGLAGLRGMEPLMRNVFDGMEVILIRPLLRVSRKDTESYCEASGLTPRLDESNLSIEPSRNRIRLDLIPRLEEYNPAIREALVRLSRSAAQDLAYIDSRVNEAWHQVVQVEPSHISLDRGAFQCLAPALQAHVLRRVLAAAKEGPENIRHEHIDSMARLMSGPAGRSLDLPGGISFQVSYDKAYLTPQRYDRCPLPPFQGEHALTVPGETLACGWRIVASLPTAGTYETPHKTLGESEQRMGRQEPDGGDDEGLHTARLDYEALGGRLYVRARRPGDRFQPLGMPQAKKLQDFMVDAKIQRCWRDRTPLVVSERGIAWVMGWRIAEWAKLREQTGQILELRFIPLEGT